MVVVIVYIEPIPLELLGDSVTYTIKGDLNEWGDPGTSVELTLNNVRVTENKNLRQSNIDYENNPKYRLFYDMTNSSGLSQDFVLNGIIVYEGIELRVNSIFPKKAFGSEIHHYEVDLV